jgi:ABC-type sugar transport system substrate-binding protein
MKRIISNLVVGLFIVSMLVGWGSAAKKTEAASLFKSTEQSNAKKDLKIGISFAIHDGAIHQAYEDYIKKAAKDYTNKTGRKFEFTVTVANGDVGKQSSDIQDLIVKGMDVIMIYAQDSKAIHSSIKAAHDKGIPVVMFDRAASAVGEQAEAFVGLDTLDQAYTTGVALFELLKKDKITPRVLNVIGDLSDENAVNRDKGFKKAAKEAHITFLQDIPSKWNPDMALSGFTAALQAHPNTNVVLIASDYLTPAIQTALKKANKWKPYGNKAHVYIGSQDVYPIAIDLMGKGGYIDFNTAYDIWPICQKAVQIVVALADKEKLDKNKYLIAGRLVDKKNVNTIDNLWSRDYQDKK